MAEDIEQSFMNWASDLNASRYFAHYQHIDKSDTENMINHLIQSYEEKCNYIWAIEVKESGDVIGHISVDVSFASLEMCEIGYILGSLWWNKGYGSEALEKY